MKKGCLIFFVTISLLLISCEARRFYINKPGFNISYAIAEGISYPSAKRNFKKDSSPFEIKVMVANLYYGKNYDGIEALLVDYGFESINISLLNSRDDLIKQYDVDVIEYAKKDNGISSDNYFIKEKDFKLVYSFDLIDLFQEDFSDKIRFQISYVETMQEKQHSFSRVFSFRLVKTDNSIFLKDFDFSFVY